jgi:hypothetical protein
MVARAAAYEVSGKPRICDLAEHDHRRRGGAALGVDSPEKLKTVHVRGHEIEDNQIWTLRLQDAQRALAGADADAAVPELFQQLA